MSTGPRRCGVAKDRHRRAVAVRLMKPMLIVEGDPLADTGASSPRDMGKVMAAVKDKAAGRADMGVVSARIKARLAG